MLLMNGKPVDQPVWNRGLAFGDGVFETVTFRQQRAALWKWHMQRLEKACRQLQIEPPASSELHHQCLQLLPKPDGIIRINLVRRHSHSENPNLAAYGPAPGVNAADSILVYRPMPSVSATSLITNWGQLRLSRQPLTAGLKHLNRLEQVLAAREADLQGVDELLLKDTDGNVIEAISSNLLVYDGSIWITPCLHDSGVAGVMRQWLLDHQLINEQAILEQDVTQARALAVCNSVRGVRAIEQHAGQAYSHAEVIGLQQAVIALGLS